MSGPYLRAEYGFYQGFDHYDDYTALTLLNEATSSVTSPILLGLVQSWLGDWDRSGRRKPFFVFLHMWDVHYDYIPPSPYDELYDPGYQGPITGENVTSSRGIHRGMASGDLEHLIALYDGEIRYTDHHLGLLFRHLSQMNALANTIIAITSDHGEAFFEHGFQDSPPHALRRAYSRPPCHPLPRKDPRGAHRRATSPPPGPSADVAVAGRSQATPRLRDDDRTPRANGPQPSDQR